ncbi:hypothetical protein BRW65_01505 [Mycobacterium paraffinicum]|uniref:Thioesterase n=1 Tax=Mycobacterium paraffinicum TaxID=53378 RepID=A0A1Q4I2D1_9MYCO|nr:acyl-CoA thioesterase domain-containing protein [Mycobacterium paraffinicum]OJZ76134.1 hypothetical protein BRW65_01505 [Mycobacterium paraffinicum]
MGTTEKSSGYFIRDDDDFVPQPVARGPWGDTISGHTVGGLLAWAVEEACGDPLLRPSRLTVDLLRPAAMAPVRLRTCISRRGKRIMVVDAELLQDGGLVSRASSVFLRHGDRPDGDVWAAPPARMPPIPDPHSTRGRQDPSFELWCYGPSSESTEAGDPTIVWAQNRAQKFAWVRETHPPVDGSALTAFARAALAADVTNGLTHWSTQGLSYINVDYTVALSRQPEGEFIGLASEDHQGADGIAAGAATLFDEHGPFGKSIALALAQPITL